MNCKYATRTLRALIAVKNSCGHILDFCPSVNCVHRVKGSSALREFMASDETVENCLGIANTLQGV